MSKPTTRTPEQDRKLRMRAERLVRILDLGAPDTIARTEVMLLVDVYAPRWLTWLVRKAIVRA